jgi:glycosyltransferase involved in cell wall biosynthesis
MPSKSNPTLSIVIPSHNRALDLIQVLDDLRRQTAPPFEIVVNDDCSDATELKLIKRYVQKYAHQIRFYENKKNLGLAGNSNEAVRRARGMYVTIVNNDDRVSPYYVERILAAIRTYAGFNVYTTNAIGMTEEKQMVGDYRIKSVTGIIHKKTGISHLWNWYFTNLITISGASIYRTSYKKSHPFNIKYGNEADLDCAMMFLATEDIMYIDESIYFVRMHHDQTSRKIRLSDEKLIKNITTCMSIYQSYPSHKKHVWLYLQKVKGIHIIQLAYKYHYSYSKIKKILKIKSTKEFAQCAFTIPWFVAAFYLRIFSFHLRKPQYKRYAPPDIQ